MDLNKAQQTFYDFIFPYLNHRQQHGCVGCHKNTLDYNFAFVLVDAVGLVGCEACEKVRPPTPEIMALCAKALEHPETWSPEFAGMIAGISAMYFGSIQNAWDAGMVMGKALRDAEGAPSDDE